MITNGGGRHIHAARPINGSGHHRPGGPDPDGLS
jgi:hypothetical protein